MLSDCVVLEVAQGSTEWHQARAGVCTASMFAEVRRRVGGLTEQQATYVEAIRAGRSEAEAKELAGYKSAPTSSTIKRALAGEPVGDFTDSAKDYAFRLAVERISGTALDDGQYETWAMRRGKELEPEARSAHAFVLGLEIQQAGFVHTSDRKFGASADGLICADGGSEYKCLVSPERIRSIVLSRDISEFTDQVQGCMWITGRSWWHFVLYCPALAACGHDLTVFEVRRDDAYISAMEADLIAFDALVCRYVEALQSKVKP